MDEKTAADAAGASADLVAAAGEKAVAAILDPSLRPGEAAAAAVRRWTARQYPQVNQAAVLAKLADFTRVAVEALRVREYRSLDEQVHKFGVELHALTIAPPPAPEIEKINPMLRAAGWCSGEIDLLARMLKPGEALLSCDASGARFETRTLTRRQIRDGGRPAWWKTAPGWSQPAWESQFRTSVPIPGERQA